MWALHRCFLLDSLCRWKALQGWRELERIQTELDARSNVSISIRNSRGGGTTQIEINKHRAEKRRARESVRIENCREALKREDVIAELRKDAHPIDWRAEQGATREDWAAWMMRRSGNKGRLQVARYVEGVVESLA